MSQYLHRLIARNLGALRGPVLAPTVRPAPIPGAASESDPFETVMETPPPSAATHPDVAPSDAGWRRGPVHQNLTAVPGPVARSWEHVGQSVHLPGSSTFTRQSSEARVTPRAPASDAVVPVRTQPLTHEPERESPSLHSGPVTGAARALESTIPAPLLPPESPPGPNDDQLRPRFRFPQEETHRPGDGPGPGIVTPIVIHPDTSPGPSRLERTSRKDEDRATAALAVQELRPPAPVPPPVVPQAPPQPRVVIGRLSVEVMPAPPPEPPPATPRPVAPATPRPGGDEGSRSMLRFGFGQL